MTPKGLRVADSQTEESDSAKSGHKKSLINPSQKGKGVQEKPLLLEVKSTADTKKHSVLEKSSVQIKTPAPERSHESSATIAKFQISGTDTKTISESAKKSHESFDASDIQEAHTKGFRDIMRKLETEGHEGETELFFFQPELETECFLPPNTTPHRFTLILDLDETLVHFVQKEKKNNYNHQSKKK